MQSIRRATAGAQSSALKYAKEHGWKVDITRRGHLKFTKEGSRAVYGSVSPGAGRAEANVLAELRREDRRLASLERN